MKNHNQDILFTSSLIDQLLLLLLHLDVVFNNFLDCERHDLLGPAPLLVLDMLHLDLPVPILDDVGEDATSFLSHLHQNLLLRLDLTPAVLLHMRLLLADVVDGGLAALVVLQNFVCPFLFQEHWVGYPAPIALHNLGAKYSISKLHLCILVW